MSDVILLNATTMASIAENFANDDGDGFVLCGFALLALLIFLVVFVVFAPLLLVLSGYILQRLERSQAYFATSYGRIHACFNAIPPGVVRRYSKIMGVVIALFLLVACNTGSAYISGLEKPNKKAHKAIVCLDFSSTFLAMFVSIYELWMRQAYRLSC